MESHFARIRAQCTSELDNQKQIALMLLAVEDTLKEQNEDRSPLVYFGALMSILEQQTAIISEGVSVDEDIVGSATYLLAIVFPHVSLAVLRHKFNRIGTVLAQTFDACSTNAPIVRSVITCLEFLLLAQEAKAWKESSSVQQILQITFSLSFDARPKVRKRAQDAILTILQRPPPPAHAHPAANLVLSQISYQLEASLNDNHQTAHHLLAFLMSLLPIVLNSPSEKTNRTLTEMASRLVRAPVRMSSSGNLHTVALIFQVLGALFSGLKNSEHSEKMCVHLLTTMLDMKPNQNDPSLAPAWLKTVSDGLVNLSVCPHAIEMFANLTAKFFSRCFRHFLLSDNGDIVSAAGQSFSNVISHWPSVKDTALNKVIENLVSVVQSSLGDIQYREAWGSILIMSAALFTQFGNHPMLPPVLVQIIEIRDDEAYNAVFPFKSELDSIIKSAVLAMGLETFFGFVPHNIEHGAPKRPYVLGLIVNALNFNKKYFGQLSDRQSLLYYSQEMLPLAHRMYNQSAKLFSAGKEIEARLFETLATQIWSILPLLCRRLPADVGQSDGNGVTGFECLLEHIQPILMSGDGRPMLNDPSWNHPGMPDLRPTIYTALKHLVDGYFEMEQTTENAILLDSGKQILARHSSSLLTLLCQKFCAPDFAYLQSMVEKNKNAGTSQASKSQALQTLHEKENQKMEHAIVSFLKIANSEDIDAYFMSLVKSLLEMETPQDDAAGLYMSLQRYAMIDLIVMMQPCLSVMKRQGHDFLSDRSPVSLLYRVLVPFLKDSDKALQKRAYKALNRLVEFVKQYSDSCPEIDATILSFWKTLAMLLIDPEMLGESASGSKKARMDMVSMCVSVLARHSSEGHSILKEFVPSILPELLLASKETSEKTRFTAFEVLIVIARQLKELGGASDAELFQNQDEDMGVDSMQNLSLDGSLGLKDFLLMLLAGLAGETSGMKSAAISCLGRIIFEFRNIISVSFFRELLKTVCMATDSGSRELVKAGMGFMKIVIVCVPAEHLKDELEGLVQTILKYSSSNNLRVKGRHLLERLIRRFSLEAVDAYIPEEHKKLINNIRKRRERSKRNKDNTQSSADMSQKSFAELMQDSDSDIESDQEDMIPEDYRTGYDKKQGKKKAMEILEDEDGEVVDFLDANVVSRVTQVSKTKKDRPVNNFKQKGGKLVIEDSDEEEEKPKENYYLEAIKGEDGFERLANGKIKFNKKRKMEETPDHGSDEEKPTSLADRKKAKKQANVDSEVSRMLGRQFKAKKAKGDVRKQGMPDPYAYIPLNPKLGGSRKQGSQKFKSIIKASQKGTDLPGNRDISKAPRGMSKANKRHK